MSSRPKHFCARCGRKRGDGRCDRGWLYWFVDVHQRIGDALIGPVQVPVCFCAFCWRTEIEPEFAKLQPSAMEHAGG